MNSEEIRRRFLKFFEKRGHTIIPSASLVPENDPSVLFTTAGMHPLVPYLLGQAHPSGDKLVNVQKCVRTQDIDEVGDNTHDTFFEMLGNWSLGAYFKEDAIKWSYEFLTSKDEGLGLDVNRLYVTCFEGDENAPRDEESAGIWKSLGIPENRIYFLGAKDNWWSPGPNGPCGPDTEMFYDLTGDMGDLSKDEFLKATDEQKIVEVWNDVFMEYEKADGKVMGKLKQKNVDTGAGLERLAMVMQEKNNIFDTDLFTGIMNEIDGLKTVNTIDNIQSKRIIADHLRTSVFMVADGVVPSNTDRGYVLRRLLRRAILRQKQLKLNVMNVYQFVPSIIETYKNVYPNLVKEKDNIEKIFKQEGGKFLITIHTGDEELWKLVRENLKTEHKKPITGKNLFDMYSTHGYPLEVSLEHIDLILKDEPVDDDLYNKEKISKEFNEEMKKHQDISRQGSEQKFKGGLADTSEMSVKYHTATHLLHKALREVLGNHVFQKGSNITPERLRFDFSHGEKMTDEQKKRVEDMVNEKISEELPVTYEDLPLAEAEKKGAVGLFEEKYGDTVRVYKIGDFSLEFCGGPHVKNTSELGHFKIAKEEACSAGIRRIKAVLE